MRTSQSFQDENLRLKAELQQLREELELKNNLISSLEAKVVKLHMGTNGQVPNSPATEGGDSLPKIVRNSSTGITTGPLRKLNPEVNTGLSLRGPELGYCRDSDDVKPLQPPKMSPLSQEPTEEVVSTSLLPPSRNYVEMQQPLAPTNNELPQVYVEMPSMLENNILESGEGYQLDEAILEGDEEEERDGGGRLSNGSGRRLIKATNGAIKALPRELSIYNSPDDDVTKYSIEGGMSTCELEKTEMRDAYNARGLYTGAISRKEQMPHGRGRMEYHHQGRVYDGDWHMGHWHGYGIIHNAPGDVYEGKVVNDLKEGEGKLIYSDGRVFKGRFKEDEAIKGTITFPDGAKYVGELHNSARHGYGVYMFADGSKYEGQSDMNIFAGKGKMTWTDGGWYEGEWSQGEVHGQGIEIRSDGSLRHEGRWSKGVPIRL
jgi:hypothetical protein